MSAKVDATHKKRLGVVFGSRSVEHEVSIITAVQLMKHIPEDFKIIPLYIDKMGRWWTGSSLRNSDFFATLDLQNPENTTNELERVTFQPDPTVDNGIDVAIFCTHGGHGEDGTLAGLFELAGIPYAAPGVVAAGVAIDKLIFKHVMQAAGVPVTEYVWFTRDEWHANQESCIKKVEDCLEYPLFVKPATLGSSVGVTRVINQVELRSALDVAVEFDSRLLVEVAANDCIEINVSVTGLGNGNPDGLQISVTEQPLKTDDFLSYADKYERGGGKKSGSKGMASLSRRIPAPISGSLTTKLNDTTKAIWRLLGGKGVARIDFFANISTEEIWVGEVNAPPGSMAFYLWEATGISYSELIVQLISDAQKAQKEKHALMHSIASNILQKKEE